jgi:hypothetical protein
MSRMGRYWLFFVIVAVGLALSWGQVGRKTQTVLEAQQVDYLSPEPNCFANQAPCAAVSEDHALVLGPAGQGFRLKQTGFEQQEIVSVEATAFSNGTEEESHMLAVGFLPNAWSIEMPVKAETVLRIRLATAERISVADFPLAAGQ